MAGNEYIKRTWADIDLDAVEHNLKLIRSRVGSASVMCIVKADAYGHGAVTLAGEYRRMGVDWFGVSNIAEAVELRNAGIAGDILILGYTPVENAELLSRHNVTQAVYSAEYAQALSAQAASLGLVIKCHLKLDSGMGRIGFDCRSDEGVSSQLKCCAKMCALPALDFTGVFTHFAVADDGIDGEQFTSEQYKRFTDMIAGLGELGITFKWRHCCNSAGILEYPDMQLDMVRPGIILYGLSPSEVLHGKYDLHPVMSLRSVVSFVKRLEMGATVSYGRTFTAQHDMIVATVPVGYADGYPRVLSGRQDMLVHGRRAPIIGRVCMDQLMLDVTDIPGVAPGDVVTVFGKAEEDEIPIEELCDKLGTINYELACRVARRVPRVYYRNGQQIGCVDYNM